jgi:hypothetical protein
MMGRYPVARAKLLHVAASIAAVAWLCAADLSIAGLAHAAPAQSPSIVLPPTAKVGDAKRLALVVGNGDYRFVPSLKNTLNDAEAVAGKLRGLGFEVHFAPNVDRFNMNQAIARFLLHVEPDSEVVVYYSGHGVEVQGSNYLLPVDIPELEADQERLLRSEAVNLTDLLTDLQSRHARVSLVILDACRDNPFQVPGSARGLGSKRGLGQIEAPSGSFVIFSAGVGEEALDNLGAADKNPNGVFTRTLLQYMSVDGLELRTMVRELRGEVRDAALSYGHHSQVPSYYDELLGDFYFKPKIAPKPTPCDVLVHPGATTEEILAADLEAGVAACSRALAEDPSEPRFVHLLYQAQEQRAFQKALKSDVAAFSEAYLTLFPNGRHIAEVNAHLTTLTTTRQASAEEAAKAEIAAARATAQAETAKAEAVKAEAAKAAALAEATKAESARIAAQTEIAKAETAKEEAVRAEAVKAAAQAETAKAVAAKVAAQAEASKAEAVRAAAQADIARAEAAKAESAKVAALTKANAAPENAANAIGAPPTVDARDIAQLIQIHLKRIGCDPGGADGEWNAQTKRAIDAFNIQTGLHLDASAATVGLLEAVRTKTTRVCPLVCGRGYRVDGERCVQITCEAGFVLGGDGTCQRRREPPRTVEHQNPAPAAHGGGKCFSFNGRQFCE